VPATIAELFAGRTETIGSRARAEICYAIFGAADENEVRTLALGTIARTYLSLILTNVMLDERFNDTTWKVRAIYEAPTPQQQDNPEPTFAFDTGGGTQHITQSLGTRGRYGPAASAELAGAIGFDGQNVNGVDITVPVYQFSETHYFVPAYVTQAYKLALMATTGTVNIAPFRGFDLGEVLFLGASGTRKGMLVTDPWEISFKFAAQKNQPSLTVGGITGIAKYGWDYLWVQYGADVDATAKVLIKKPIAVYVEKVYPDGDFSWLGIGA
jgi:hypothetical protein